ncbi:transport protein particle component [Clavulina sp. PMI_390]|nr:transport protein particle component [Clavulina sp. PMI_390]
MSSRASQNPSTTSLPQGFTDLDGPRKVDAAALDFLMIEMTRTLKHSSEVATKRHKEREAKLIEHGLLPPAPPRKDLSNVRDSIQSNTSVGSAGRSTSGGVAGASKSVLSDNEEAVRQRLEAMGAIVGANLAERLSRSRTVRFAETLDIVKFLCKDVWTAIWDKPVDNLRTNHRGVYVLQDNSFKPLLRISSPQGSPETLRLSRMYLAYPAGLIKGALMRLGLPGTVVPEVTTLPQCTFQVKLPKSTA